MTLKEAKRAIRNAKYIFSWVQITVDDGMYVQTVKGATINALGLIELKTKGYCDDIEFNVVVRDNEPDSVYIN